MKEFLAEIPFNAHVGLRLVRLHRVTIECAMRPVGLKRAGYKHADVAALKKAYQILYRSGLKLADALARIETEIPTPETRHLVEFVRRSERGICRK